jgi:branched-chain amino acid transport system permease protein
MDLTLLGQAMVNGLLFGGVYSLIAVGLALIFGVMRIINFAHGDFMVWGMYLAFLASLHLGADP